MILKSWHFFIFYPISVNILLKFHSGDGKLWKEGAWRYHHISCMKKFPWFVSFTNRSLLLFDLCGILNWWIKYFFSTSLLSICENILCTFLKREQQISSSMIWRRRLLKRTHEIYTHTQLYSIRDKLMIVTILIRYKSWQSLEFIFFYFCSFIQFYCFTFSSSIKCRMPSFFGALCT